MARAVFVTPEFCSGTHPRCICLPWFSQYLHVTRSCTPCLFTKRPCWQRMLFNGATGRRLTSGVVVVSSQADLVQRMFRYCAGDLRPMSWYCADDFVDWMLTNTSKVVVKVTYNIKGELIAGTARDTSVTTSTLTHPYSLSYFILSFLSWAAVVEALWSKYQAMVVVRISY